MTRSLTPVQVKNYRVVTYVFDLAAVKFFQDRLVHQAPTYQPIPKWQNFFQTLIVPWIKTNWPLMLPSVGSYRLSTGFVLQKTNLEISLLRDLSYSSLNAGLAYADSKNLVVSI